MKKKIFGVLIVVIILILILGTAYSYGKFGVVNPFMTAYSLIKVIIGGDKYVVVQQEPHRVIFSKGDSILNSKELLDIYMQDRGFHEVAREQMGSEHVYTNGSQKERILYTVNDRYSEWEWEQ